MTQISNSWLELNIKAPSEKNEVISAYFTDYTLGNHIEDNCIKMYFDFKDKEEVELIICDIRNIFEIKNVSWSTINEENWMENWMENFHPVKILDKVLIIPDWNNENYNSIYTVKIHPAMAFGTGHHASTQLIVEHMINYGIGKYDSLLDLGCGSGILSFLSKKMGVKNVTAIDVDPICEENFYKNSKLNDINDINFSIQDVHQFENYNFNVIIANIDKKNIIKIINKFEDQNTQSVLMIAGFLYKDRGQILGHLKTTYADCISKKGEWGSMVIKRRVIES